MFHVKQNNCFSLDIDELYTLYYINKKNKEKNKIIKKGYINHG